MRPYPGVQRGNFHITTGWIGDTFRASTAGSSPRNSYIVDSLYALFGFVSLVPSLHRPSADGSTVVLAGMEEDGRLAGKTPSRRASGILEESRFLLDIGPIERVPVSHLVSVSLLTEPRTKPSPSAELVQRTARNLVIIDHLTASWMAC